MQSFLAQKRLFTAVLGSEKVANPVFKAVENRLRDKRLDKLENKFDRLEQKVDKGFNEVLGVTQGM